MEDLSGNRRPSCASQQPGQVRSVAAGEPAEQLAARVAQHGRASLPTERLDSGRTGGGGLSEPADVAGRASSVWVLARTSSRPTRRPAQDCCPES